MKGRFHAVPPILAKSTFIDLTHSFHDNALIADNFTLFQIIVAIGDNDKMSDARLPPFLTRYIIS